MELESFVFSAVVLLAVTSFAVAIFKHLGLGSVLGLLVAGILGGPHTFGPTITTHVDDVRQFTELGVVLLMFLIGLEMRPSRLWEMRWHLFGLGSLQVLLCGVVIAWYADLYQKSWLTSLLIGMTLALSSTAFVMQLLQQRGEAASRHGSVALAILLMQDLAVVPLLALMPILSETGTLSAAVPLWQQFAIVLGILASVWGFGRWIVPLALDYLARRSDREAFFMVVMFAVFFAAWAMRQAGLSMALGAFFMGMLLSESRYSLQIQALVEPYKGLLMSLFFVAVGMSIDLGSIAQQPFLFVQHTLVIVAAKLVILFLLGLLFGLTPAVAVRLTFYLAQGGEFGFVVFSAAKALGVIDAATFLMGIGVVSVTMLITPLLVNAGDALAKTMEPRAKKPELFSYQAVLGNHEAKVVIGGYGRVGQTVALLLHNSGVPFIAFDTDTTQVALGKSRNFPVFFGDIGDLELLDAARVGQASLVVLTIDHIPTLFRALSHLRNAYPHVPVIARARDLQTSQQLLRAGAINVFPEAVESSLLLSANALELTGVPAEDVERLLRDVRNAHYEILIGK